ncbi:hypothetical protein F5B20DRAFT_576982 [Whalleya microplaca]|nr:hypothetical protein F5B20DRAFT_576982 [Whalleya microplaca]
MSGLGPSDSDRTPDYRGPALLAVSVTTTVLAFATCVLRYCVKTRTNRTVAWDDYSIGLAMILGLVGVIFTIVGSVGQGQLEVALQFDFLAQPWLNMALTVSTVSTCLSVLSLDSRVGIWRVALDIQIIPLLLVNLAFAFAILLQCRPLERLWKPSIPGECWSLSIRQNLGYFQGAFAVFSQLSIALFTIMVIQNLRTSHDLRWPFYMISSTSIVIAMLTVVRTYNISLIRSGNQLEFQIIATILAVLEQNLGIFAANILPIASLCSKTIRPIGQALTEAESDRDRDIDAVSISSKGSRKQINGSEVHAENSPRAVGDEGLVHRSGGGNWPMGIMKTVSIEVVKENVSGLEHGMDISQSRRVSSQEDWDRYLQ